MANKKKDIYNIPLGLSFIILGFDILALCLSFIFSNFIFPNFVDGDANGPSIEGYNYHIFFYTLILFTFTYYGHYRNRVPYWQQILTIVKSIFLAVGITAISYYVFNLEISLLYVVVNWLIALILFIVARSIAFSILRNFKRWWLPITLLGDNQMVIDCMFAFYNDGHTGYSVKTIMLRDRTRKPICLDFIPEDHPEIELFDASGEYLDYITQNPDNFYIIDMEGLRGENRDNLIKLLENNDIAYAIAPPTKRLHLYGMDPLYFFGNDVMILHSKDRRIEPLTLLVKRAFDIIVSLLLLPFLGLFAVLVWILKKAEKSDTPLFYGGKRLGKNGKEFSCWKFNSMRRDADQILEDLLAKDPEMKKQWDLYQKLPNDPRIDSKISHILRKTSLDELPQIWNVFVGDMSLVGPRPILPQQTVEYGEFIHLYEDARPGITGLWQVSGRNETTFNQRIYWDSWYVKNWSLWHDIVIMLKTVSVLISKRGAG